MCFSHCLNNILYQQFLFLDYLVTGPAFEAVGVELVDMQDVNGTLDAEMVQLTGHFEK